MSIKIPRSVSFFIAYSIAFALYWPALYGTPIWDDLSFWFGDPVMQKDVLYLEIFKNYAWPVSVSLQKFLLSIWNFKYFNYHFLNLLLHFANAFLVYRLGRWLKLRYSFLLFCLFLVHPVAVISTAWMIQIKTLLCFFFAMISVLFYLKAIKKHWWFLASWIFFTLSLLSKSPSLTLTPLFFFLSYRYGKFKKIYFAIPFLLVSIWSGYKVVKSPVTLEATDKVEKLSALKLDPKPAPAITQPPAPEVKKEIPVVVKTEKIEKKKKQKKALKAEFPKDEKKPEIKVTTTPIEIPKLEKTQLSETAPKKNVFNIDLSLISQSLYYYFWQAVIPLRNEPVKGLNYEKAGFTEIIHIFFLTILVATLWKTSGLFYLLVGHLLLIPFIGFVNAPYMTITWVSDQHLYLALPMFIGLWLKILEKVKFKYKVVFPVIFVFAFCFKTFEASKFYKNQVDFYEASLYYNPYNIPIAYNLAYTHIMKGQWALGYNLMVDTHHLIEGEPVMKKSYFYPYFLELYLSLKKIIENHAKK